MSDPGNAVAAMTEPQQAGDTDPLAGKPEPSQRPFRLWMRDLVFSVAASFFIITFLYQPVRH